MRRFILPGKRKHADPLALNQIAGKGGAAEDTLGTPPKAEMHTHKPSLWESSSGVSAPSGSLFLPFLTIPLTAPRSRSALTHGRGTRLALHTEPCQRPRHLPWKEGEVGSGEA